MPKSPHREQTEKKINQRISRTQWLRRGLVAAGAAIGLGLGAWSQQEEAPKEFIGYSTIIGLGGLAATGAVDTATMLRGVRRQINQYDVQESGGEMYYLPPQPNYIDRTVHSPIAGFAIGFNAFSPSLAMAGGLFVSKMHEIATDTSGGAWVGSAGVAGAIVLCEVAATQSTSAVRDIAVGYLDRIDATNIPMD
ncbi:MAG: hypothetical protein WBP26_02055 [Candidatus Saccharimonadales bacterium]